LAILPCCESGAKHRPKQPGQITTTASLFRNLFRANGAPKYKFYFRFCRNNQSNPFGGVAFAGKTERTSSFFNWGKKIAAVLNQHILPRKDLQNSLSHFAANNPKLPCGNPAISAAVAISLASTVQFQQSEPFFGTS
jgi:hypothetical protein